MGHFLKIKSHLKKKKIKLAVSLNMLVTYHDMLLYMHSEFIVSLHHQYRITILIQMLSWIWSYPQTTWSKNKTPIQQISANVAEAFCLRLLVHCEWALIQLWPSHAVKCGFAWLWLEEKRKVIKGDKILDMSWSLH